MQSDCLNDEARSVLEEMARALSDDAQSTDDVATDDAVWIGLYRAQLHEFRRFAGAAAPMHRVSQRQIDQGGYQLTLRVYTPLPACTDVGVLYLHGGGSIGGSLDTHDRLARALAMASGSVVFAVDYPLAPEHPFPAAPEAAFAAFSWLRAHAAEMNLDPNKLVVIGDSIGGLLAAVVAVLCRDRHTPPPALQMSLYPNMDLRTNRDYPSMHRYDGVVVKLAELERGLALYLPNAADRRDPRASPLACSDFRGLAPAWVLTCECDPLRDEGRRWASSLEAAGGAVVHREAHALPHAFLQMGGRVAAANSVFEEIGAVICTVEAVN
jgi:acetyl esterase